MYKAIMLPFAKQDIKEAALWYESKQNGLGKRFTSHIREKVALLQQDPYSAATRYKNIRTSVLDVFPYMIHYIIDDPKKSIIITAVLHTSRNPNLWVHTP